MSSKVLACFLVVAFHCANALNERQIIINQFQPTLQSQKNLSTTKLEEVSVAYNTLVTQIVRYRDDAKKSVQTRIEQIRNKITSEVKNSTDKKRTACLNDLQTTVSRLSNTVLNACYSTSNTSSLNAIRNKFSILANVASNTVSYCGYLNPLESQNYSLRKCLSDKTIDLETQIRQLSPEYSLQSTATLDFTLECLSTRGGGILQQIGNVNYRIITCSWV